MAHNARDHPNARPAPEGRFADRRDAGRRLAALLADERRHAPVVLALPRGGVPVGYEVARALEAPLDLFLVRKLGVPGQPELGMGAVTVGGTRVLNEAIIEALGIRPSAIELVARAEEAELARLHQRYRGSDPDADPRGRALILVDDGLATGITALAAVRALRQRGPRRIVLAVPVCAPETAAAMRPEVDALICVQSPADFLAVGSWYQRFDQTTDDEVVALLAQARQEHAASQMRA